MKPHHPLSVDELCQRCVDAAAQLVRQTERAAEVPDGEEETLRRDDTRALGQAVDALLEVWTTPSMRTRKAYWRRTWPDLWLAFVMLTEWRRTGLPELLEDALAMKSAGPIAKGK